MKEEPTPGSDLAREQGCICPVLDNSRGRGYRGMDGIFVIHADCVLHGDDAKKLEEPHE